MAPMPRRTTHDGSGTADAAPTPEDPDPKVVL
jgi:hypothetical protein